MHISLTYQFFPLQIRLLSSLLLLQFKEKASAYFNADGSLNNVTPQDYRERLLAMLDKYRETLELHNKSVVELGERVKETKAAESTLKKALAQTKKKADAANHSLQRAIKKAEIDRDATRSKKSLGVTMAMNVVTEDEEEDVAKTRVSSVLDILGATADKRRSHLESKRTHNNYRISWKDDETSAEDWPESLKRSLVMKMQRRRVQITLRPSRLSIVSDVKMELETELAPDQTADAKLESRISLERAIRSEQVLLLSLHPAEDSPRLPPAPQTSSSSEQWAEPGWKVVLDAPVKKAGTARGIFPSSAVASHGDLLHETLLPECLSAPGRQTALMIRQSHLRLLCNPLSDLSRASAPAETHPAGLPRSTVIAHDTHALELDPMNVSEEEMLRGYRFVAKKRKSSSITNRKRANSRAASKEKKQGSGSSKKRRTNKAAPSKKNKDTGSSSAGAPVSTSKTKGTNAGQAEKSHLSSTSQNEGKPSKIGLTTPAPNSRSELAVPPEERNRHPNMSMLKDPLPQSPSPMQNFSPSQRAAAPNQNPRSSMSYFNSTSTSPGHSAHYQGGEIRRGNASTSNEAQVAIPLPPPPPQRVQQNAYHHQQQQQQQQQQFYRQQQQQQQMYFAAQQQAAASQQMQSPMQAQYQQMRMQGQPTQGYSGQAYPMHQMQGQGGAVSGSGQPQPPPRMMGQGMNVMNAGGGMPPPGAVSGQSRGPRNPNDPFFQQKR